jgi:hypothetical protein
MCPSGDQIRSFGELNLLPLNSAARAYEVAVKHMSTSNAVAVVARLHVAFHWLARHLLIALHADKRVNQRLRDRIDLVVFATSHWIPVR